MARRRKHPLRQALEALDTIIADPELSEDHRKIITKVRNILLDLIEERQPPLFPKVRRWFSYFISGVMIFAAVVGIIEWFH